VFYVRDTSRAADHYRRLGFRVDELEATAALVSHEGGLRLHLSATEWAGRAGHGDLRLVVPDVDEVARAWRRAGAELVGPEEIDGVSTLLHTDPDGNVLRVRPPSPSPAA
jgi:catechol 2,3-dioxygenase-like lactoylglutathione lyase family enzyme